MAEFILKDWYGNNCTFDKDKIFVQDVNGELVEFTQGKGNPTLETLEVTENGTYTPSEGVDGFNNVVVEVPTPEITLQDKTITENGTFTADEGFDGLGSVTVAVEGASSNDVRYVTFMSYDGTTEYGKKAVAVGDDCADPIARGIFDTPTRESDAQYDYTHNGWASEVNGSANSNWNKAITEDKTVYASFASALRYYTITYYDSDGTTVLKTESLAYGAMPSYKPEKEGYGFGGWSPELATVTKDANYTVVWTEKITFANGSWADIARISEAGQAADYFVVGDEKTFVYNGTESLTAKIIGFDHEDLADGTGKAGITCIITPAITSTTTEWTYDKSVNTTYVDSKLHKALGDTVLTSLPTEMQSVIKAVNKQYSTKTASGYSADVVGTVSTKLWAPSRFEAYSNLSSNSNITDIGDMYTGLASLIEGLLKVGNALNRSFYWRDINRGNNAQPFISIYKRSGLSTVACDTSSNLKTAQREIACCFCI